MATPTSNGTGNTYPSTQHLRGVSEGEVWDGMDRSDTFVGNEDECGCQTIGCPDCAQDQVARQADEAAAIDSMFMPTTTKHIDARIESLTLTVRDLESAIARRNTELFDKRAALIHESNKSRDLEGQVESLKKSIDTLTWRLKGYEKDMSGTMFVLDGARLEIAELKASLQAMTDLAEQEGDAHQSVSQELSDMLEKSGRREDEQYETLMGVRALAQSDMLTDAEKVSLILRMVK
jgi:chromosome segregation ATPase